MPDNDPTTRTTRGTYDAATIALSGLILLPFLAGAFIGSVLAIAWTLVIADDART